MRFDTLFDLKYVSYNYKLDYDSIEIKNNRATVQLRESHEVVFEVIAPEVSKLSNLQHTFTLHYKKGLWLIYKDEYQDELSQQLDRMTKIEIKRQVDENYQKSLNPNRSSSSLDKEVFAALSAPILTLAGSSYNRSFLGVKVIALPLAAINSYNRTAAIDYAQKYRDYQNKNPAYFSMYGRDGYGGDCTNYVSQIIYAGAPKMNNTGVESTGWWYSNKGTSSTSDDKWSWSWSVVGDLYKFLTTNTSSGPYGYAVTVCSMKPGDVVQLKNATGWFHTVALHKQLFINSNCADLVNYTIIGHDADRYNYPLANYASFTRRYVTIMGWRP